METLSPKHALFAQALIETKGNLTTAYSKVYPKASYPSCRQGGWLLSKNVNIRHRLKMLLTQNGLGLNQCIKKLNSLTEADKPLHYWQGKITWQPDNYVRLQAVQTALKIHFLIGNTGLDNQLNAKSDLNEGADQ